ncbi:MAG: anti-sigma factor family protein [Longimicrobiales bacterium]
MSHVDEGALHAYLDGALDALPASEAARIRQHLASCEACARRLEEERALREAAGSILAGADPGVGAMPPLEELRQRAAARTRAGSGFRLRQLAWAASLVVAVGAGWLLRGSRDPRISEALDPLLREAAEARATPAAVPGQGEAPVKPADEAVGAVAADARLQADVQAPPATSGAGAVAPSAAAELVAGVAAPPEPAREEVADVVLPKMADVALDTLRRTLAAGRGQVAAILGDSGVASPVPPPAAPAVAPSMALTAEARPGQASRVLARSGAMMRAAEDESVRWARGDAGAISVPGLPVVSVGEGGTDLPAGTLRVLQLLEGDTLELLHLPAGADPSTVTGSGDAGRNQVAVRYGAGWLLGRAHASVDVLESLLARITGGG